MVGRPGCRSRSEKAYMNFKWFRTGAGQTIEDDLAAGQQHNQGLA